MADSTSLLTALASLQDKPTKQERQGKAIQAFAGQAQPTSAFGAIAKGLAQGAGAGMQLKGADEREERMQGLQTQLEEQLQIARRTEAIATKAKQADLVSSTIANNQNAYDALYNNVRSFPLEQQGVVLQKNMPSIFRQTLEGLGINTDITPNPLANKPGVFSFAKRDGSGAVEIDVEARTSPDFKESLSQGKDMLLIETADGEQKVVYETPQDAAKQGKLLGAAPTRRVEGTPGDFGSKKALQKAEDSQVEVEILGELRDAVAEMDPDTFGVSGVGVALSEGMANLIKGGSRMLGFENDAVIDEAVEGFLSSRKIKVSPAERQRLVTLAGTLRSEARALVDSGQLSKEEQQWVKDIIGNPLSIVGTQKKTLSAIDQILHLKEQTARSRSGVAKQGLNSRGATFNKSPDNIRQRMKDRLDRIKKGTE